ncbi:MAG: hypothetical protein IKR26_03885 [Lachnospiraceae bacterium]|nr:hypothetical protein [Lachnospiraceae bacterium]
MTGVNSCEKSPAVTRAVTCYNAYDTVAILEDCGECINMQGMTMEGGYVYAFKISRDSSLQLLHRVDVATGEVTRLYDLDSGSEFVSYMHHANDACAFRVDGKLHLIVATIDEGERAMVEIEIEGDGYRRVASYTLRDENGTDIIISAVEILEREGDRLTLLLNEKNDCWRAVLDLNNRPQVLPVSRAFTLDVSRVPYHGDLLPLPTEIFYHQGIAIRGDRLYAPRTHRSESVFVVFDISGGEDVLKPLVEETVIVSDVKYTKLEAEGLAFDEEGRLFFNTNRRNNTAETHYDGIHVVNRLRF